MKTHMKALVFALGLLIGTGPFSLAFAHDYWLGKLHIDHPWARSTAAMARNGAVYMTISNHGEEMDKLIAVAAQVAKRTEMHTHLMQNNIMKMRPVEAIEVHPGEPSVLKPGGLHIMLIGLKVPLKEGETFPLTLTFEKAGSIDVQVIVQKARKHAPGHSRVG